MFGIDRELGGFADSQPAALEAGAVRLHLPSTYHHWLAWLKAANSATAARLTLSG